MRLSSLAMLVLWASVANTATAQDSLSQRPRLALTITAGRSVMSSISRQATATPLGPDTLLRDQDLSLDDVTLPTVRLTFRAAPGWVLAAEWGVGATHYQFRYGAYVSGNGISRGWDRRAWGEARHIVLGVTVGHEYAVYRDALFLETDLGYVTHYLRVGGADLCEPLWPDASRGPCSPSEPWLRTFRVPNVQTGLGLNYQASRYLGLQLRGEFSLGRTSIPRDGTFAYWPDGDALTSQWIRTRHIAAGLSVWP